MIEKMLTSEYFDKGTLILALICFMVTTLALAQVVPLYFGSITFGLFTGTAIGQAWIKQSSTNTIDKTTDQQTQSTADMNMTAWSAWPDTCYACDEPIDTDMSIRGQFVVHKGESTNQTKATGLCEECVWTYSTLIDNHSHLVKTYDGRENPTEL
jgi:hypothetical protein